MRVNVLGTVEVTRAILPSMIDRKEGRVVFVSSQAAQVIIDHQTHVYTELHATTCICYSSQCMDTLRILHPSLP